MKNRSAIIILIIILAIISLTLICLMISLLRGEMKFKFFSRVSNELVVDKEYDKNFNKISISCDMGDVYIKETTDETPKLIIHGEKDGVKLEDTEDELVINYKKRKISFFSFGDEMAKIELYLPEDYEKDIKINNKYGDIEIGRFENSNIKIEEDCGDVSVNKGKKVEIKNKYGDIELEEAEEANIDQSAGDIKIGKVKDIDVKNNYGDIKIKHVTNYIKAKDNCGDIEIEKIELNKDSNIENDLGTVEIGSTNEIFIDAQTDLGSTKVRNNYQKSDIKLRITNNCGDIKVNN